MVGQRPEIDPRSVRDLTTVLTRGIGLRIGLRVFIGVLWDIGTFRSSTSLPPGFDG